MASSTRPGASSETDTELSRGLGALRWLCARVPAGSMDRCGGDGRHHDVLCADAAVIDARNEPDEGREPDGDFDARAAPDEGRTRRGL